MRLDLVSRIEGARFTSVRLRDGYDSGEVDRFLADLVNPVLPLTASCTETTHGPGFRVAPTSVIDERPGLKSRLFRRTR